MLMLCGALVWALMCVGASVLMSIVSPHGMIPFFLAGGVLGLVGASVHLVLAIVERRRGRLLPRRALVAAGLGEAVVALSLTMLLFDRALYFPHNVFQWFLLLYLACAAVALNVLVGRWFGDEALDGP